MTGLKDQTPENFDSIVNMYRRCAQTYTNISQDYGLDLLLQRLFNQLDDKQVHYVIHSMFSLFSRSFLLDWISLSTECYENLTDIL